MHPYLSLHMHVLGYLPNRLYPLWPDYDILQNYLTTKGWLHGDNIKIVIWLHGKFQPGLSSNFSSKGRMNCQPKWNKQVLKSNDGFLKKIKTLWVPVILLLYLTLLWFHLKINQTEIKLFKSVPGWTVDYKTIFSLVNRAECFNPSIFNQTEISFM